MNSQPSTSRRGALTTTAGLSNPAAVAAGRLGRPRPKYLLFGLIGLMMLVVLNRDLVRPATSLINPQASVWEHYRSFKWWLLPHGIAGALALSLGPLQFSERLRRRLLRWHRRTGRIYVGAVAVAAPLGIVIECIKYIHGLAPLRLVIGTSGFGILLLLTTGMAFLMVKRGNIQAHRRWMTRSYAVALIFLETRCVEQISWLAKLTNWPSTMLETHGISDMWMYIAFSLGAAELMLRSEKMLNKVAPRHKVAATGG